jgi:hypothetical protein
MELLGYAILDFINPVFRVLKIVGKFGTGVESSCV